MKDKEMAAPHEKTAASHKKGVYEKCIKRPLDIICSSAALVVLSPLLLIVSLLIVAEDHGPVFFKQKRVGKSKKIFEVYKFRTMCIGAEKQQKVGQEVTGHDPRITRIGYPLRRFKIDEVPQLVNVIKGDMSIVGPRPTLPAYLGAYEGWEMKRFEVRPGLSGLAQVNGNIYLGQKEKSRYDAEYVEHVTFMQDMKIVLRTFGVILLGEERFRK